MEGSVDMAELKSFLHRNNLTGKISPSEMNILQKHWKGERSGINWYQELFNNLGKDGTLDFFQDCTQSDFQLYKEYIQSGPHLDIGSGSGIGPLYIRKTKDIDVHCLDIYEGDFAEEVERAIEDDPRFSFSYYQAGTDFPFESNEMRSASLFYVLHHCQDQGQVIQLLKETHRVLMDDGLLIVTEEPVSDESHREKKIKVDIAANSVFYTDGFSKENGFDVSCFYSEAQLKGFFASCGFKIVAQMNPDSWDWIIDRKMYILQAEGCDQRLS
jgi:ubiquinone/menaquinone biosynthesis C-methylase UbiE